MQLAVSSVNCELRIEVEAKPAKKFHRLIEISNWQIYEYPVGQVLPPITDSG
jgi:hypothetical protein